MTWKHVYNKVLNLKSKLQNSMHSTVLFTCDKLLAKMSKTL